MIRVFNDLYVIILKFIVRLLRDLFALQMVLILLINTIDSLLVISLLFLTLFTLAILALLIWSHFLFVKKIIKSIELLVEINHSKPQQILQSCLG